MDSYQNYSDVQLLALINEGDERAFKLVYERYWNRVFSTALATTQSYHMAMDVVQDTFSVLWRKRTALTGIENLEAYIYTIGRNRIISLLRSQRIHEDPDILNSRSETSDLSPERKAALRQFHQKIQKAIQLLPPKQGEVFTMSRLQQMSYEEIAVRLGVSKDTVRNHLIKALGFMRAYFKDRKDELLLLLIVLESFF